MRDKPDQRRFQMLLREHQGIVFKVAGLYAHSMHDREDIAREIATQLWRSVASFDEHRAKFTTWMYRVALNVAISHARRKQHDISGHDGLNRALILLYLEDRSYAEIAEVLGLSETNVATKLGRIKQGLRNRMLGAESETTGA